MVHSKICEFWLSLRFGLPYNNISVTVWSENSCKLHTVSSKLSNKVALIGIKWQYKKKWVVDSFLELQIHFGFVHFWNLWLSECSFKWLNPSRNFVRSFISTGLWTLKIQT